MARKIVVTSGKGGVGKTTVAINLGAALSKKGARVIVCDADFGLNNADVVAGIENLVTYDVVDVIEGRCRAQQALVRHPDYGNLYILVSRSAPERYISPQVLKLVLEELSPKYDFILIDCPAGVDEGFHRAVAAADEAIVITTPHLPAIRDAHKVVTILKSYELKNVCLVMNMLRGELLATKACISPKEAEELLKIPLLGVIGEEKELYLNEISENIRAFRVLASNLLYGKRKILDVAAPYTGALGGLRRLLKKGL